MQENFGIISHCLEKFHTQKVGFTNLEYTRLEAFSYWAKGFNTVHGICCYTVIPHKWPEIQGLGVALNLLHRCAQLPGYLLDWFLIQTQTASVKVQALLLLGQIKAPEEGREGNEGQSRWFQGLQPDLLLEEISLNLTESLRQTGWLHLKDVLLTTR